MVLADVTDALRATTVLIAAASAVSAVEHLGLRRYLRKRGTWPWSIVRNDFASGPRVLGLVLDWVAPYPAAVCVLMLVASATLMFGTWAPALAMLLVGTVVMSFRFRGALGGGSDSMAVQVLTALLLARVIDHPLANDAAVFFIAVQSVLSYVLAGVAKLRSSAWRNGTALRSFSRTHGHRPLPLVHRSDWVAAGAGWTVVVFECSFGFALTSATAAAAFIAAAVVFHLINARFFGLGRFTWVWISTYPALYFAAAFVEGAR